MCSFNCVCFSVVVVHCFSFNFKLLFRCFWERKRKQLGESFWLYCLASVSVSDCVSLCLYCPVADLFCIILFLLLFGICFLLYCYHINSCVVVKFWVYFSPLLLVDTYIFCFFSFLFNFFMFHFVLLCIFKVVFCKSVIHKILHYHLLCVRCLFYIFSL